MWAAEAMLKFGQISVDLIPGKYNRGSYGVLLNFGKEIVQFGGTVVEKSEFEDFYHQKSENEFWLWCDFSEVGH